MNGIGGKPFINCEQFLDIKTLEDLNLSICTGIAVSDIKAGVYGPGVDNAERYGNSMINDFNSGTVGWTDWNILLNEKCKVGISPTVIVNNKLIIKE